MDEGAQEPLPRDLLGSLGQILRARDLRSARLASCLWRDSLSQHIPPRDPLLELTIQPDLQLWQEKVRATAAVYPRAMEKVLVYISSRLSPTLLGEQMELLARTVPGITKLELRHMEGSFSSLVPGSGYPHVQFGRYISAFSSLESLYVAMGFTPPPDVVAALQGLARLSDLKLLSVSADYGLGSFHLRALGSLSHLRKLECDAVSLSNTAISELANLKQLSSLHLHGIVTDPGQAGDQAGSQAGSRVHVTLLRTLQGMCHLVDLHLQMAQDRGALLLAPKLLLLRPGLRLSLELLMGSDVADVAELLDDRLDTGACDILKALVAAEGQPGAGSLVNLRLVDVGFKDPNFLAHLAALSSLTSLSLEEPICLSPIISSLTILTTLKNLNSLTVSNATSGPRALMLSAPEFRLLCQDLTALTELQLWRSFLHEPAQPCVTGHPHEDSTYIGTSFLPPLITTCFHKLRRIVLHPAKPRANTTISLALLPPSLTSLSLADMRLEVTSACVPTSRDLHKNVTPADLATSLGDQTLIGGHVTSGVGADGGPDQGVVGGPGRVVDGGPGRDADGGPGAYGKNACWGCVSGPAGSSGQDQGHGQGRGHGAGQGHGEGQGQDHGEGQGQDHQRSLEPLMLGMEGLELSDQEQVLPVQGDRSDQEQVLPVQGDRSDQEQVLPVQGDRRDQEQVLPVLGDRSDQEQVLPVQGDRSDQEQGHKGDKSDQGDRGHQKPLLLDLEDLELHGCQIVEVGRRAGRRPEAVSVSNGSSASTALPAQQCQHGIASNANSGSAATVGDDAFASSHTTGSHTTGSHTSGHSSSHTNGHRRFQSALPLLLSQLPALTSLELNRVEGINNDAFERLSAVCTETDALAKLTCLRLTCEPCYGAVDPTEHTEPMVTQAGLRHVSCLTSLRQLAWLASSAIPADEAEHVRGLSTLHRLMLLVLPCPMDEDGEEAREETLGVVKECLPLCDVTSA